MFLPIEIKAEKEDFEYDTVSKPACDIQVKVEQLSSPQTDWCLENEVLFKSDQYVTDSYSDVIGYEELTEYGIQICRICKQMFQDSYSLLCHNLIHLEVQLIPIRTQEFQCDYCLHYFDNRSTLHHHIVNHHECQTLENDLLVERNTNCGITTLYSCHVCNQLFTYKVWFDHVKEVHSVQTFQCDLCSRKFQAKRYLRNHINHVHKSLKTLKNHINHVHKSLKTLKCSQCPAVFNHKTNLHLHIKNCHCDKVKCDICMSVLKKSNLPNHMRRVHYNDGKEHKCECGKKFRSPRYLKIHIKNSHNKAPSMRVSKKRQTHKVKSIEGKPKENTSGLGDVSPQTEAVTDVNVS